MATILFAVACVVLLLLQGADIWSTHRFLAAGVKEANPLMRLCMDYLGGAWWVPKVILVAGACAGAWWLLGVYPAVTALILVFSIGQYVVVVWRNLKAGNV